MLQDLVPASNAVDLDSKTTTSGPPVRLFTNIDAPSHLKYLRAQSSKRVTLARNWLDNLPPVLDAEGKPLPVERKARAETLKKSGPVSVLNVRADDYDSHGAVPISWDEVIGAVDLDELTGVSARG